MLGELSEYTSLYKLVDIVFNCNHKIKLASMIDELQLQFDYQYSNTLHLNVFDVKETPFLLHIFLNVGKGSLNQALLDWSRGIIQLKLVTTVELKLIFNHKAYQYKKSMSIASPLY